MKHRALTSRTSLATLSLVLASAASTSSCIFVDVRGDADSSGAVWNLSPSQAAGSLLVGANDPSIRVCCPREGGDLTVSAVIDPAGAVHDFRVERPPLALASAALCVSAGAIMETLVLLDDGVRDEADEIVVPCNERKQALGGSWLPGAVPAATSQCFERFFHVPARANDARPTRTRIIPVSLDVRCPAPASDEL